MDKVEAFQQYNVYVLGWSKRSSSFNVWLTDADDSEILTLIERDQHRKIREITELLKINKSKMINRLRHLGMVSKVGVCVPSELPEKNLLTEFLVLIRCWSATKSNNIWSGWLQVMEHALCIIMLSISDHGLSTDMPLQPAQISVYILRRFCLCIWGELEKNSLLSENHTINSQKYCSKLNEINEHRPETTWISQYKRRSVPPGQW